MNINNFINDCKQQGLNVTYQRIAIYKALMENAEHPTAEDIYNTVKQDYPTISLATVYKSLETLAEHNIISKVTHLHNTVRYDGETDTHHHLICIKCKSILDVYDEKLNGLKIPEKDNNGFQILDYKVQFEGICSDCQKN
jgi:Fur family peroxide stress response transcriptional regulator